MDFLLDGLQRIYDLAFNTIVAIPLDGALSIFYIIGNFILQLLFLGNDPTGGGLPF